METDLEKAGKIRGKVKTSRAKPKTREQKIRQAQKLPQAVIKIASYASGAKRAGATLDYISRDGKLMMEDQDGNFLVDKEQIKETLDDWAKDFGTQKKTRKGMENRDTMHLVLSTPKGSNTVYAENSARDFLTEKFSDNHEYLFSMHEDTKNPHVHIVIKTKGFDSKQLRTNKHTLNEWRDNFAKHLIRNGIEVDASSKLSRGVGGRTQSIELKNTIKTLAVKGIKTIVETNFTKGIQKDFSDYQNTKKIKLKGWEVKAKKITAQEKKSFKDEALEILKESKLQTGKKKEKSLSQATLLNTYADSIPEPKSNREHVLELLIEKTKELNKSKKSKTKETDRKNQIDFD